MIRAARCCDNANRQQHGGGNSGDSGWFHMFHMFHILRARNNPIALENPPLMQDESY